ncbi:MAG: hypothetical protein ACRDNF_02130 [Streptosporangiaceae bacterium]
MGLNNPGQPQDDPAAAESVSVPALVSHYVARLQTWVRVTPETSLTGNRAEVRLRFGEKVLVAVFGCRKKTWSLCRVEIRCGEQVAAFTRSELAKAVATLLGEEPIAPAPQAAKANPRPRTDMTLRERRITVIRT